MSRPSDSHYLILSSKTRTNLLIRPFERNSGEDLSVLLVYLKRSMFTSFVDKRITDRLVYIIITSKICMRPLTEWKVGTGHRNKSSGTSSWTVRNHYVYVTFFVSSPRCSSSRIFYNSPNQSRK